MNTSTLLEIGHNCYSIDRIVFAEVQDCWLGLFSLSLLAKRYGNGPCMVIISERSLLWAGRDQREKPRSFQDSVWDGRRMTLLLTCFCLKVPFSLNTLFFPSNAFLYIMSVIDFL